MRRILLLIFLFINALVYGHWDVEYWQGFEWTQFEKKPIRFYGTILLRLNDHVSRFYFHRVTENLCFEACKYVDFELHYSLIYSRPELGGHFIFRHRGEFEINPHFKGRRYSIYWRNRLELIKRQHEWPVEKIFRHRTRIVHTLKHPILTSFEFSNEIHYNLDEGRFTQNRFIPFGFTVKLNKRLSPFIYVMIRNYRSDDEWGTSLVFGTHVKF